MKFFLDTEFLEDGKTIDLISIAIVSEIGSSFYYGNIEADWNRIYQDEWLMNNVVTKLPPKTDGSFWAKRSVIKSQLELWIINQLTLHQQSLQPASKPEFWAYYASYDWVALCQLFGKMIDLPSGFPMYCKDFKQLADEYQFQIQKPPKEISHDALEDTKWLKREFERFKETRGIII